MNKHNSDDANMRVHATNPSSQTSAHPQAPVNVEDTLAHIELKLEKTQQLDDTDEHIAQLEAVHRELFRKLNRARA